METFKIGQRVSVHNICGKSPLTGVVRGTGTIVRGDNSIHLQYIVELDEAFLGYVAQNNGVCDNNYIACICAHVEALRPIEE